MCYRSIMSPLPFLSISFPLVPCFSSSSFTSLHSLLQHSSLLLHVSFQPFVFSPSSPPSYVSFSLSVLPLSPVSLMSPSFLPLSLSLSLSLFTLLSPPPLCPNSAVTAAVFLIRGEKSEWAAVRSPLLSHQSALTELEQISAGTKLICSRSAARSPTLELEIASVLPDPYPPTCVCVCVRAQVCVYVCWVHQGVSRQIIGETIGCTAVIRRTLRCVYLMTACWQPLTHIGTHTHTHRDTFTPPHPIQSASPSALQSNVALPPCMTVSIQLPRKWIHIQPI